MGVHVDDAQQCAEWLVPGRGALPLESQWDKAAGFYERNRGLGPCKDEVLAYADALAVLSCWPPTELQRTASAWLSAARLWQKTQVALNRLEPMQLGEAKGDVSRPFGCRDMAGNGKEWTRRVNDRLTVPVENANPGYTVELRGRTYRPAGQRGALRDPLP